MLRQPAGYTEGCEARETRRTKTRAAAIGTGP